MGFYMQGRNLCTDDDDPTLQIHCVGEREDGRKVYVIESGNHPLRTVAASPWDTDIAVREATYEENSAWIWKKWPS